MQDRVCAELARAAFEAELHPFLWMFVSISMHAPAPTDWHSGTYETQLHDRSGGVTDNGMDQLTKTLKKFAHRCATETVKRVPAAPERVVQRNTNTRIDTTTLTSQLPSGTVMKTQPRSEPKKWWKLTGDHFPWVVGALWTLIVTGASGFSAFPAVIIGCIEIAFFVYNKLLAQNANKPALPERMSRDLIELWDNCLKYSPDGAADFLSGWFYDAPLEAITKQDLQEFLAWGSCSTTWDLLTDSSKLKINAVYGLFELRLEHRFPERQAGQEPLPCMRFSIEPMEYKHKPTSYYWVCSFFLGLAGKAGMHSQGFSRHRSRALNYWIRIPETEEARARTPIVFVHGIGVGLAMYLQLIKALVANDCPVVCIELPFISSTLGAHDVPSIRDQVQSVDALCTRWGFTKAVFVGHSYGSVMLSWMAQHLPQRVAGMAFIDPVVLMLNLKNVLYNFLYKKTGTKGVADIIGTELGVNIALRRNFWWYRNILWASDLQRHALPTVVCLSEHDEIGPALAVDKHIAQHSAACADKRETSCVESYMMQGATHGGFLFDAVMLQKLSARISQLYSSIPAPSAAAAIRLRKHRFLRSFAPKLSRPSRSKSQEALDFRLS